MCVCVCVCVLQADATPWHLAAYGGHMGVFKLLVGPEPAFELLMEGLDLSAPDGVRGAVSQSRHGSRCLRALRMWGCGSCCSGYAGHSYLNNSCVHRPVQRRYTRRLVKGTWTYVVCSSVPAVT